MKKHLISHPPASLEGDRRAALTHFTFMTVLCIILLLFPAGGRTSTRLKSDVRKNSWVQPVKLSLSNLFRGQKNNGDYDFPASQNLLKDYPLPATFSRLVADRDEDMSFASMAIASCSRYVRFLLTERDQDSDFLVERSRPNGSGYKEDWVEHPGFNLLLALDILNLSNLNLTIKRPIEALFWREEAKLLAKRVVEATFDIDSKYFFPLGRRHEIKRFYYTSSLMGAYFDELMGENISRSLVKHFLLTPQYVDPERPFDTINWKGGKSSGDADSRLLEVTLMLGLLSKTHLTGPEDKYRKLALSALEAIEGESFSPAGRAYDSMLKDLIAGSEYRDLFPRFNALDIFCSLVKEKRALSDPDLAKLEKTAERIKQFIRDAAEVSDNGKKDGGVPITNVQSDIRNLYIYASKIRAQLKESRIYNRWQDKSILGFDLLGTMPILLDDVIRQLKEAENIVAENKGSRFGLKTACILLNEKRVPGEKINFMIKVTTASAPINIKSIEVLSPPYSKKVFSADSPLKINPGDTTLSFTLSVPFRTEAIEGVEQKEVTVRIITEEEGKIEKHFFKGIVIEKPVDLIFNFPQGRILRSGSLPIEVKFKKNVSYGASVAINYYSPSGLSVRRSTPTGIFIPGGVDTASSRLDIIIPEPCRPGSFLFYARATANGRDLGSTVFKLFKHYQWVFIGPFGGEETPITTSFQPEARVNLLDRLRSGGSIVRWRELPTGAYSRDGRLNLESLIPQGTIGYLYTVLKTTGKMNSSLSFSSTAPAIVFVNGYAVLQVKEKEKGKAKIVNLSLRNGINDFLIKIKFSSRPQVFFDLGDQEDLTPDDFNNNLWDLVEGYGEFHRRNEERFSEEGEASKIVTLSYIDPYAHSVAVIGSFNGWSPESSNMRRVSPNRWEITLHLPPGKYTYRFLINNQKQILDPRCPYQESDGYGGKNSVLYIE